MSGRHRLPRKRRWLGTWRRVEMVLVSAAIVVMIGVAFLATVVPRP